MTKSHFISFMAYVTSDRVQFIKLYPEGNAETRFQLRGSGFIYIYCNKHGLWGWAQEGQACCCKGFTKKDAE